MTTLREAAQQALEAINAFLSDDLRPHQAAKVSDALRAALSQEQAEPVASLMTHVQSGDVEVVWNDDGFDRELWHETPLYNAPPRCPNCASLEAQNTELDRKLAELEQAEPVQEPVATTQQPAGDTPPSDYRRGYWDGFAIGKREGRIEAEDAALKAQEPVTGIIESEIKVDSRQTLDDAMQQPRAMAQAYESGYKAGAAAERERIIQFLQEMQRVVGDAHNHYGVAAVRIKEGV